jgi:hypothetical protein
VAQVMEPFFRHPHLWPQNTGRSICIGTWSGRLSDSGKPESFGAPPDLLY